MQKYLHISNIYCIFAVRLGIVPRTTIKHNEVMSKTSMHKVCANGKIYRIVAENMPHFNDVVFRVYIGRKLYCGISTFFRYEQAFDQLNNIVAAENSDNKKGGKA